jgi:superfamily II DNA or RNA helicase
MVIVGGATGGRSGIARLADVLLTTGEATFITGDPPRTSALAFWGGIEPGAGPGAASDTVPATGDEGDGHGASIELVLPTAGGRSVRRRTVRATVVPVADLIDDLVGLGPAATTGSLRVWAAATRAALDLISRGRLNLAASPDGWDRWQIGPYQSRDREHLLALAAALPPTAHAVALPGTRPLALRSAADTLRAFYDAVADALVRTSAAPTVAGQRAFAAPDAVDVSPAMGWLHSLGGGGGDEPSVALRLEPPMGPDDPFCGVLQVHSLVVDAEDLWRAGEVVRDRFGDRAEEAVLLALRRGAQVFEPLGRLLDDARPARLLLDDDEAELLLGEMAIDVGAAGIEVLWPVELTKALSTRTVVGTPQPEGLANGVFSLDGLLDVSYEALLDGHPLSARELEQLVEAKRPLIRLRDRFVVVDPSLVARLRRRHDSLDAATALSLALGAVPVDDGVLAGEVVVVGPITELAERLTAASGERHLPEPPGLDAELRHYQQRGLAWLVEMASLGLGGCLADDMGLGKTIQLIAAHLALAQRRGPRPTLVVCPASLLGNWRREVRRFAPEVPDRRYHGPDRSLEAMGADEIVVTTYGVLRRDTEALAEVGWGLVVADEAQHVKNPLTRSARALRAVPADARFAMTGTPVENRLSELWALLDWSTPGLLPDLELFQRAIAVPIERDRDEGVTERFGRLVKPFLLRRRKIDPGIAPELPPKTETDVPVMLSAEQATLYKAVLDDALERITEAEGITRQGLIFKLLTGLKQICNHPAHYLDQRGPIGGRSGKLETVEELLRAAVDGGESVLVFTQYVAMGHLLHQRLADLGIGSRFLHGSLPVARRDELVEEFQRGGVPVFVLSLKAAGTGLNLTRATQVVHYDRWWNPAVEDQASDRAWRIGQDRPVQVHRLITEGTLEERIAATLADKRRLAEAVVGSGEGWIAELGDDELRDLLSLRHGEGGS